MTPSAPSLLLAIDGGGTKTECWLARNRGAPEEEMPSNVLGRGRSGPANPSAVGIDGACCAIKASIESAFQDAGIAPRKVHACVIGLAGGGNQQTQRSVQEWVHEHALADEVRVVPDCELVLWAGTPDGIGIALISGTGSMAFGRNERGETARAGGWGYLIHDGGSAFSIGQAALEHTARASDDGVDLGEVGRRILARLDVATAAELPLAIHAAKDPRAAVASLAEEVFAAADLHDADAVLILDTAAEDLATLIAAVERKLSASDRLNQVVAAGSVLARNPKFMETVRNALSRTFGLDLQFSLAPDPVVGAIRLAERVSSSD